MAKTFKVITQKKALGPFIMLALFNLLPLPQADYAFVLLGRGGWSFNLFNFTNFIGLITTNALLLVGVTRIGKWLKYNIIIAITLALFAASVLMSTTVIYSDKFDQIEFSVFYIVALFFYNVGKNLVYITIVGRISKYLPEGFESTGVTILIACNNLSFTGGQYLGSEILAYYDVKAGYYDRLKGPQVIGLSSCILLTAISPILLPI